METQNISYEQKNSEKAAYEPIGHQESHKDLMIRSFSLADLLCDTFDIKRKMGSETGSIKGQMANILFKSQMVNLADLKRN